MDFVLKLFLGKLSRLNSSYRDNKELREKIFTGLKKECVSPEHFLRMTNEQLQFLLLDRIDLPYGIYLDMVSIIEEEKINASRIREDVVEGLEKKRKVEVNVPPEIIGEILQFLRKKDDFLSFLSISKQFNFYVNNENPYCARNIIFKITRTPEVPLVNEIKYVFRLHISMLMQGNNKLPTNLHNQLIFKFHSFYKFNPYVIMMFPNLIELSVNEVKMHCFTGDVFKAYTQEQGNERCSGFLIERLEIVNTINVKDLGFIKKLPNLKTLLLRNNNSLKNATLENNLGKSSVRRLLVSKCNCLTGDGIMKAILKSSTIKEFGVENIQSLDLVHLKKFELDHLEVTDCPKVKAMQIKYLLNQKKISRLIFEEQVVYIKDENGVYRIFPFEKFKNYSLKYGMNTLPPHKFTKRNKKTGKNTSSPLPSLGKNYYNSVSPVGIPLYYQQPQLRRIRKSENKNNNSILK